MSTADRPKVTLKMLIDAGILSSGQTIYPINSKKSSATAVINEDGTIGITIGSKIVKYQSLSSAATAVEYTSINGWIYWGIRESDQLIDLATYRAKFKQTQS